MPAAPTPSRARRRFWRRLLPWRFRVCLTLLRAHWLGWLWWLPFSPLHLLGYGLRLWIRRTSVVGAYADIQLVQIGSERYESAFAECTKDALALIEEHDPRRFRRIRREVRRIVNQPISGGGGRYLRGFRECAVDFAGYYKATDGWLDPKHRGADEYLWYLALYAAVLVHEATHGRLASLGIPYSRETRVCVERLCHREEERFAAHLPQDTYSFATDLLDPFDARRWERHWNRTWRQRKADDWALFRKTVREIGTEDEGRQGR